MRYSLFGYDGYIRKSLESKKKINSLILNFKFQLSVSLAGDRFLFITANNCKSIQFATLFFSNLFHCLLLYSASEFFSRFKSCSITDAFISILYKFLGEMPLEDMIFTVFIHQILMAKGIRFVIVVCRS
jgi:hypothetical protein